MVGIVSEDGFGGDTIVSGDDDDDVESSFSFVFGIDAISGARDERLRFF